MWDGKVMQYPLEKLPRLNEFIEKKHIIYQMLKKK